MARIEMLEPSTAPEKSQALLAAITKQLGRTPNMFRTLAHSPAVLEAYTAFSGALKHAALSPQIREQIALLTGEQSGCQYCLAAHSALGRMAGLSEEDVLDARRGTARDPRAAAALTLAGAVIRERGRISNEELKAARAGGLTDGEILEVVAVVCLNIYTNYLNHVADPAIDFPAPAALR